MRSSGPNTEPPSQDTDICNNCITESQTTLIMGLIWFSPQPNTVPALNFFRTKRQEAASLEQDRLYCVIIANLHITMLWSCLTHISQSVMICKISARYRKSVLFDGKLVLYMEKYGKEAILMKKNVNFVVLWKIRVTSWVNKKPACLFQVCCWMEGQGSPHIPLQF